ncbi:flagellar basal body rod protein FlgC [Aquipuribacter nitratireducens]|uniref:Flagellar basal body rod protein FlgC n=1 Tax=Aquipuribacter nitratireducens TaxID=650104 RepID=A0ABW0GP74_9MICO
MTTFPVFGVAGSGVAVYRKWLDAVSDNISNINTVRPTSEAAFRARYVIAQATQLEPGVGGVTVGGIRLGSAEGRMVYDPTHPFADEGGYVRLPDIDLGSQMTQLMMAQRGYQANLAVVDRARDAYSAAINVGRNA